MHDRRLGAPHGAALVTDLLPDWSDRAVSTVCLGALLLHAGHPSGGQLWMQAHQCPGCRL